MIIIDKELIELAIKLARPSIEAILATPEATWGPKWVEVLIDIEGIRDTPRTRFGRKTT